MDHAEIVATTKLGYKSLDKDLDRCLTTAVKWKEESGERAMAAGFALQNKAAVGALADHYVETGHAALVVDYFARKLNGARREALSEPETLLKVANAGEAEGVLGLVFQQLDRDFKSYRQMRRRPSFDAKYPANAEPPIDKLTGKDLRERDDPRPWMLERLDAAQMIVARFGSEEQRERIAAMRSEVWEKPLAD